MSVRHALALLALPTLLAACPGEPTEVPGPGEGQLVVGVQTDDFGGLIEKVHIVAMVDGTITADQTVSLGGSDPALLPLPREILLRGAPGAKAEIVVEGMTSQGAANEDGAPNVVVTRRASARLLPDVKKLLRINLDTRCMTFGPRGGAPIGPSCAAPQTCVSGQCTSEEVPFEHLETYEPTWATSPPDVCRPANHGDPELVLGTGQTDYASLAEGQTLMLERGPQGGHHVWIAVRMKNLRQSGSRTTLTAKVVDDPASPIPPASYVFTFDRDEGNYCKLWGLRFQLDSGASDLGTTYKRFLGRKLEITAEVIDSTNARAASTRTVLIGDKLLCPDGTTSTCNP